MHLSDAKQITLHSNIQNLIGANTAHMKQMSEELMNGQQIEQLLMKHTDD